MFADKNAHNMARYINQRKVVKVQDQAQYSNLQSPIGHHQSLSIAKLTQIAASQSVGQQANALRLSKGASPDSQIIPLEVKRKNLNAPNQNVVFS